MADAMIRVVYDGQCPACRAYCKRYRETDPDHTTLLDAREPSELMEEITRRGWDIDDGMVVERRGELYHGAEALRLLAASQPGGRFFERLNRLLFSQPARASRLYPLLRSARNLLLKLRRVDRINNLQQSGRQRF